MRLWTIHPRYLDARGLVALWREALLARAVLRGRTRGYRNHPQLARFRAHRLPRYAINAYLAAIHAEGRARGYSFDAGKIGPRRGVTPIPATRAQIAHEWRHLMRKLALRNPSLRRRWRHVTMPRCHPLFKPAKGPVESWERAMGTKQAGSRKRRAPRQLIDARIRELGDWRGKMLGRLRGLIRQADPDILEEWKWNVPVWSHDGLICTGETYRSAVKLTFAQGAALPDPSRLFNASLAGNTRRAIDFREGAKIDEAAFKALIRAAVALNRSRI